MVTIKRTNSLDVDFIHLVKLLDADLKVRDGEEHDFYNQFNAIVNIQQCLVAFEDAVPVGCGAIKTLNGHTMEVKRMYVVPEHRGKGIASKILLELENWAKELNYTACILETGLKQPEAIALYKRSGYQLIPNYGQYIGVENSVCFEKQLS